MPEDVMDDRWDITMSMQQKAGNGGDFDDLGIDNRARCYVAGHISEDERS